MDIDTEEPPPLVDVAAEDGMPLKAASPLLPTTEMSDLAISTVPLTIVTGYLGSGKTTLVNYVLNAQHGKKIAVILNEFGDSTTIEERAINISNIDQSQTIDFLTLGNGCICCSVKDAGLNAIEQLLSRHASSAGTKPFDAIVLETSGLADPGGIIPNFWTDEGLGSSVRLDGVVTVVDASNALRSLDEPVSGELAVDEYSAEQADSPGKAGHETVAHLQLSSADSIILNKTDLVESPQLEVVEARIRSINAVAAITRTRYGQIPQLEGTVTDLHAYDHFDPSTLTSRPHGHLDPTITTITLTLPPLSTNQLSSLDRWLQLLLWENILPPLTTNTDSTFNHSLWQEPTLGSAPVVAPSPSSLLAMSTSPAPSSIDTISPIPPSNPTATFSIYRTKGLLPLLDGSERMVQGVREIFEITTPEPVSSSSTYPMDGGDGAKGEEGKIVFIGRRLDEGRMSESLRGALGF